MAEKVKFRRGLSTNLPSEKVAGTFLVETDTGTMYVDDSTTSRVQIKDNTKVSILNSITNDEIDAICNQDLSGNEVEY